MPAGVHSFNEAAKLHNEAEPMRTRCERCDGPVDARGEHCPALPSARDESEIIRRLGLLAVDDPAGCLLLLIRPIAGMTLEQIAAALAPITGREVSRQMIHKKIAALAEKFPDLAPMLTPRREAG